MKTTPSAHTIQQQQAITYSIGKYSRERPQGHRYVRKMRSTLFHCNNHAKELQERKQKRETLLYFEILSTIFRMGKRENAGKKEAPPKLNALKSVSKGEYISTSV